ncbi:MAG: hypothetical protein KJZ64_16050 [Sphingomonadaceae bacterium]|nr:hypothetical protein [Sphingomonadaceae bacterium]
MTNSRRPAPWHLWAVGVVTLLWNGVGIASYMMTRLGRLADMGMTADQISYFDTFPAWANSAWALGVWGAFFASILLLLRHRWAVAAAAVSVVGLLGTTIFQHVVTTVPEGMSSPAIEGLIWATTLFTLWYALRMKRAGVLG